MFYCFPFSFERDQSRILEHVFTSHLLSKKAGAQRKREKNPSSHQGVITFLSYQKARAFLKYKYPPAYLKLLASYWRSAQLPAPSTAEGSSCPTKTLISYRVGMRPERQFLPPDNFQKIPCLVLFSLQLGHTGSRPKEQRGGAPADSMDLQLDVPEDKWCQRSFVRKLKELKGASACSPKLLPCYGAALAAAWQLKSAKQGQPGKTPRDGQNCSSEHTSLWKTCLTVTKGQQETTTPLIVYAPVCRTNVLSNQHTKMKGNKKNKIPEHSFNMQKT